VLIVVSLILVFNVCLARLFTVPGAVVLNAGIFWLLLRLVVRVLLFPGSVVLWKRRQEAVYRVELARDYAQQLEQLHAFLQIATSRLRGPQPGATLEGAMLGCEVVENLARNLRAQQRDQVRFTQEQARLRLLVTGVEAWLGTAKVSDCRLGRGDAQVPLTAWMQRMVQSIVPIPLHSAAASASFVKESEAEAGACIERLEQLVLLLDGLHHQQEGLCTVTRRFLRVPTVGSLHHLRAELQLRYAGRHCWVRTPSGRKVDAMFIPCPGSDGAPGVEEDPTASPGCKEDVPLKEVVAEMPPAGNLGPVIVSCNPNAGYYETMFYESQWLDFYLSQGFSVFLFNYSGYGRSQGFPTPSALLADGNAVLEYLRRRGYTQVAVHGRSIGGIVACELAQAHPDLVKLLIADRTFSSLATVAKYLYGNWAVNGLNFARTWADNIRGYLQARCYKVMICDPKDITVPDIASLRSAVAREALARAPASERLSLEEGKIQKLAEAWCFFDTLMAVCDRDGSLPQGHQCSSCRVPVSFEAKRPARQPVVGKPQLEPDGRLEAGEEDTQRLMASRLGLEARKCTVNTQWLEEHVEAVQGAMLPYMDSLRLALDAVGTQLNAGGLSLDDALGRPCLDEACEALRCFLANIQVWGSHGISRDPMWPLRRDPLCPPADRDVELFLQRPVQPQESVEVSSRLAKLAATLTPDRIATYHRQLSRRLVLQVRREFRQHLAPLRRVLEAAVAREEGSPGAALCVAVLAHLREIEGFMTVIYRFFKCVDVAGGPAGAPAPPAELLPGLGADAAATSDDSEEGRDLAANRPLRPPVDRTAVGYLVCTDSGHNGALAEAELQHLVVHLRAARFGRYANNTTGSSLASL